MRPESSFWMAINQKKDNDVTICWHDIIVNFFWSCQISLVKFSYSSKFHVNIMTGCLVMTIFVYEGLTRNSEIGNSIVWVLPNIWRLGQVRIPNLAQKSLKSTECCKILGLQLFFYRFWVKRKPTGVVKLPPSSPRLR